MGVIIYGSKMAQGVLECDTVVTERLAYDFVIRGRYLCWTPYKT